MQYQEILALVKAGYTRAEIEAMQAQPAPVQPSQQILPQQIAQPAQQTQPATPQAAQEINNADAQALLLALTRAAQAAQTVPQQVQPVQQIQPQQIAQPAQPAQPVQQTQPAPMPFMQPVQQAAPQQGAPQQSQPVQQAASQQSQPQQAQAQPGHDAQQILRALGGLAAGVAIPSQAETLEDRMGNTLIKALGLKDKEEKTGGLNNGIK